MYPKFVSPIASAPQPPIGITKSRVEIARIAPQIDKMMMEAEEKLHKLPGSIKPAGGCTVSSVYVSAVLSEFLTLNHISDDKVCSKTILIELPSHFEKEIATMAVQCPELLNWWTTCRQSMHTYLQWECRPTECNRGRHAQQPTHLWVLERDLAEELQDALNKLYETAEPGRWCWQPVILVCGASVEIGGFALDYSFIDCLQVTTSSAVNFNPYRVFTDEELALAALEARRIGRTPWFDGYWQSEEDNLLGVRLLQCNTPFDNDRFSVGVVESTGG
jgi:hypothetical protein